MLYRTVNLEEFGNKIGKTERRKVDEYEKHDTVKVLPCSDNWCIEDSGW
jgi:hypothetical protein